MVVVRRLPTRQDCDDSVAHSPSLGREADGPNVGASTGRRRGAARENTRRLGRLGTDRGYGALMSLWPPAQRRRHGKMAPASGDRPARGRTADMSDETTGPIGMDSP